MKGYIVKEKRSVGKPKWKRSWWKAWSCILAAWGRKAFLLG